MTLEEFDKSSTVPERRRMHVDINTQIRGQASGRLADGGETTLIYCRFRFFAPNVIKENVGPHKLRSTRTPNQAFDAVNLPCSALGPKNGLKHDRQFLRVENGFQN